MYLRERLKKNTERVVNGIFLGIDPEKRQKIVSSIDNKKATFI